MKKVFAIAFVSAAITGCAVTPELDEHFGDAVATSRLAQTISPQGSAVPVMGLDGKAAKETMGRYLDSFKAPPPSINVINIGGELGK